MSAPFFDKEITFKQPNGDIINLRGWGDEYYAVFETIDGYTILPHPDTGFLQYADLLNNKLIPTSLRVGIDEPNVKNLKKKLRENNTSIIQKIFSTSEFTPGNSRWEKRIKEAKAQLIYTPTPTGIVPAPPPNHTIGSYIGLCLLIEFPDERATISREEVFAFCNKKKYKGYNNNGSVRDYFLDNSFGLLDYQNIITPYYMARHKKSYYTDSKIPMPIRTRELIYEALDYFVRQGFDFSSLSVDNEYYVYALNVFYAGKCTNFWKQGLWPHAYHFDKEIKIAPDIYIYDYQISAMESSLSLGVFCHENGHMLCSFPDLYDWGFESYGVGKYCLMANGPNADKKNPTQINAYLKYKAGWAKDLIELEPNKQILIYAESNEFCILRKNNKEYIILENRVKSNRDKALPDQGLAIWHVDETGSNNNQEMTNVDHYECTLIQADGKKHLEQRINMGDPFDLYKAPHASNFNSKTTYRKATWWDHSDIGIEISNISTSAKEMTFLVNKS